MEVSLDFGALRTFHGLSDAEPFLLTLEISSFEKRRSPRDPLIALMSPFLCQRRMVSGDTLSCSAAR